VEVPLPAETASAASEVPSALAERFRPRPPPEPKLSPRGTPFLSLDEVRRRHRESSSPPFELPDGTGSASLGLLPVPERTLGRVRLLFLSCRTNVVVWPYALWLPPSGVLALDPATGASVGPAPDPTLGPDDRPRSVAWRGANSPPVPPELERKQRRIEAISPQIWRLYEDSAPSLSAPDRALVREYRSLFPAVVVPELVPYYKAASPGFFAWLDRSAG
jgi:hypothetical protein